MFRTIKWIVAVTLVGGVAWLAYKWYTHTTAITADAWSLIPSDAIYCIATDDPVSTWKDLSGSETWRHLQRNSWFATLTSSANRLDSIIRENELLTDMIGARPLIISAHMTGFKQYDFLFMVDVGDVSGIKFVNDYFSNFTTKGVSVQKEQYLGRDLITIHDSKDNSNLYLSIPGNYLIASFNRKIIASSLEAVNAPDSLRHADFMRTANELPPNGGIRLFINYKQLPAFTGVFTNGANEYVSRISKILTTTALAITINDEIIKAEGHTSINDSVESYIKTLAVSGRGPNEFLEITPQRTSMALALGFDSFSGFFENFEKNIQQDVTEYQTYRTNLAEVESYLGISLQKNFVNWIGNEVAILELQSTGPGLKNETALVLKAHDIEQARKDLDHIEKMVRRKTPVKFKAVDHRGYPINYVQMKSMFKVLLGKFFARYDKPYYTIINNFVIFSNHPQTLESIIDDYLDGLTLNRSEEFMEFRREFSDEGCAFVYLNTPVLFNSLKTLVDKKTQGSMEVNRDYIICFRHIGFQLVPAGNGFTTLLAEKFTIDDTNALLDDSTAEHPSTDTLSSDDHPAMQNENQIPEEDDPMALPYIYVENLSADSYRSFYPDSTIHYEVSLRNGFKHGVFTEFYESGEVKMKGHFKDDKRDGTWRLYNEQGDLLLKRVYELGQVKKEKERE